MNCRNDEVPNPIETAIAHSVRHADAAAHIPNHSLRAADYALIGIKLTGKAIDTERRYHDDQLPPDIRVLVLTARTRQNLDKT